MGNPYWSKGDFYPQNSSFAYEHQTQFQQMKQLTALFLALVFLMACGNGDSGHSEGQIKAQEETYKEMMAIHDEVMPLLSSMVRTSQELQQYIPSKELDPTEKEQIYSAMQSLNIAEEAMMGWMSQIRQPVAIRDTLSPQQVMQYLEEEKAAIEAIGRQMQQSLDNGQAVLKQFQQGEVQ